MFRGHTTSEYHWNVIQLQVTMQEKIHLWGFFYFRSNQNDACEGITIYMQYIAMYFSPSFLTPFHLAH